MTTALDDSKYALISRAEEVAKQRHAKGGPPTGQVGALLRAYYRHVPPEDVCDRGDVDVYGALASHYQLARERPQGTAAVRVVTPTITEEGWSAGGHSVVEVVTDDMPFLVDSVTMELSRLEREVHLIVHPQFEVTRDVAGGMQSVSPLDDGKEDDTGEKTLREAWMHVEIDRLSDDDDPDELCAQMNKILGDVRASVEDWPKMQAKVGEIVGDLHASPPPGLSHDEVSQGSDLLAWLSEDHFTFLGYREYRLDEVSENGETIDVLRAVPGTGLGILRPDQTYSPSFSKLPAPVRAKAREKILLVLAKANSRSTVHRNVYLDYVGVKVFDDDGNVVGEQRFLGLFSSAAYTESITRIPLLREKSRSVLSLVGVEPLSHAGKALMDTLENYPRDELFQTPLAELAPIAEQVLHTRERRQLRLFIRRDTYGRYLSVLVYLPRDRYSTTVRERFSDILKGEIQAESVEFSARIAESTLARVHFVVRPPKGELIEDIDSEDLERRLAEAARSWRDDFLAAVVSEYGETNGTRLGRLYSDSFPEGYKEDFFARTAAVDLGRIEALANAVGQGEDPDGLDLSVHVPVDAGKGQAQLKVYRVGSPLSLSQVLPMLTSMGVEVVDERPYDIENLTYPSYIYEFGLQSGTQMPDVARELFQDAVRAAWDGRNEIDGFNALVLRAGITWRQATVLRAYAKYAKQGNSPFALDYIEDALYANVEITQMLVQLFTARFGEPGRIEPTDRETREADIVRRIETELDEVASLDQDRILRSYLTLIRATLRTNYFQPDAEGNVKPYISFKLNPSAIPDLPSPRPAYEIFVYSPRVEGVHLRFGAVARGGLRWSDRRDDFRTEVLGLVKAQMVKNTVIVPVGSKGGFFCKQLPDPGDREAWMAEGIECYKTFISGLLDVTDNRVDEKTVPARGVVRHDGNDNYLVVAADKGTASFSDIANQLAVERGFWLGDAFASGGSVGYDHKGMGITARGAWVSVQRHFREMGIDCQTEEFTAVGVGDMSGDVFGNGMLLSRTTRLVAAFDHRDIFLDPSPEAETSYAERERLFNLGRSSWQDYDKSTISAGGGVYSRSLKSVPVSAEVREALGLDADVTSLPPQDLLRAILLAPVDLLWNGGIGTYVKATAETDADAGDKGNDAIRVNGKELRTRCVGEGGNLGFTQLGRIEYARKGGRINTDFIDNSAGVDTSDHEVNIKILLDRVVANGDLTTKQRNELLASMTDEVAGLVLANNYQQNLTLANAAHNGKSLLHVHEDWIRTLERRGTIDRKLEGLPTRREMAKRIENGGSLSGPELAVLMSWTKIVLADELAESDLPDDDFLFDELIDYFPTPMQEQYRSEITNHPLRREIIVTKIVGNLVNGAGMTYWPRLAGEIGESATELIRANFAARRIFDSPGILREIASYDNQLPAELQTRMRIEMRTLVERTSRWLLNNRRPPLDMRETVETFRDSVATVFNALPDLVTGTHRAGFERRRDNLIEQGVPEELAIKMAVLQPSPNALGIVETAQREGIDVLEVAQVHFQLGERLELPLLGQSILALPREDRWQTMARAAVRDDLYAVHDSLTSQVLTSTDPEVPAEERVAAWEESSSEIVDRAVDTLREVCAEETSNLARMSVGLKVVRGLLSTV